MKKNKKLLISFLAINSILSSYTGAGTVAPLKYDKMYESMTKNIEKGKSNENNYKLIEQVLNKRNKELKDLYKQSDYIVKPEYLEWQIFFSGFYEEYGKGLDNSSENEKYHTKTTGYYDTNGNYVVTSGTKGGLSGKPYLPLQKPKEVDLGISLQVREPSKQPVSLGVNKPSMPLITPIIPGNPTVNSIVPTLPPLVSFAVPNIGTPTSPTPVTLTPPSPSTVVVGSFDPVNPIITIPVLFTPPSLTYTAGGFGQTTQVISQNEASQGFMLGNYGELTATTPVIISASNGNTSYTGSIYVDGTMNPYGSYGTVIGTLTNGSYNATMNAFYSMVGDFNTTMTGNYTVNNTRSDGKTTIFISYNPYEVNTTTKSVTFNGTVTLNNSTNGGQNVLVGVEHQLLGCNNGGSFSCSTSIGNAPSIFENLAGSQIVLNNGINMIGIMVDSEGTQLTQRSETMNNGEIIMSSNSSQSIGIDFGQYQSSLSQTSPANPYVIVRSGNITINGSNSYGVRVGDMFSSLPSYYGDVEIDGSNGIIKVNGIENVGISLSKQITKNMLNPIGNITNLRITLNGDKGVGILRNKEYNTNNINTINLNNTNLQDLVLGDNATNSVLIRTDKYGVSLDKNISVNNSNLINTAFNNVVMLANDTNNLGSNQTFVQNNSTITIGNNLSQTTGLLAINGGYALNSGIITIDGEISQGISIFGTSGGTVSTGTNTGTININGKESLGVYNAGTFGMSSGTITSAGKNSIGVYADNTTGTTISGGQIVSETGGIALYSGDNSTINLSGSNILKAKAGGLLFYNYIAPNSTTVTGKYNITSSASASVDAGGMLLYAKVSSLADIPAIATSLKASFLNPSNLTVNMAQGSNILYVDSSTSGTASINSFAGLPDLTSGFFNFAGSGYYSYVMNGFDLTLDNTTESNLDNGSYGKIQFLNTDVTVVSGINVVGTNAQQIAIAQKNKVGNLLADRKITNNGTISLSGNQSTAIAGDYVTIKNTASGEIKLGTNSIGMYVANGSDTLNQGLIELGSGSVGIYGKNYFDGIVTSSVLGYGDDKINIQNEKDIKTISGGVVGDAFGLYADNTLALSNSLVNLTTTSNIDLKGTGNVIGTYLKNTDITNAGTIKVESSTTGTSVGIYGEGSRATSLSGTIDVSGGAGTGIYLKNSNMTNSGTVKIDNVTSGIGIYVEATTGNSSTGINNGTISVGSNVTGMYSLGSSITDIGTLTNTGTIQSLTSANKAIGIYVGSNGAGNNTGNIYLTALGTDKDQVGIYNSGTFNMTGGNVEVFSPNGAGLYTSAGTTTNLSGGTIKTGNGAIGLYANNSTIQLSGTYKSIVENGGIFALNNGTGNLQVTGNIVVDIEAGGIAFSSIGNLATYLGSLVTGGGTLELNLKDSTSKLAILDSPASPVTLSSVGTIYAPGSNITSNVKISNSSNPNYTPFSLLKGVLIADVPINLNNSTEFYNKSDFINSSVDINSTINGSILGQIAVGQVNYGTGILSTDRDRITINNNGMIDLSGDNSTGVLADFGKVTNTIGNTIKVTGDDSVGIYGSNGTLTTNNGTINIGNESVGIFGLNYLTGSSPGYGTGKIDISNNGNITSTGVLHGGYGIYANNLLSTADSEITLGTGSNIDVSSGEAGIGIYATNSTLNIDGTITVGKNGIGVYTQGSTGTINGGTISLNGDNAIGYYLTNGSSFTNLGGNIHVNGQNIILMITDATSSINLTTPFSVSATSGSTYVVGNMIGGDFYNNTSVTLGSNGSLINGVGTATLFDTSSNINSVGTNVSGMVISGLYTDNPFPHSISGTAVNEEGTNLGLITLGNSSAGMYLKGGARARNEGTISVGNSSVGIYAEGNGAYIVNNNGLINVGEESTGLFLKDGNSISNMGISEIKSTSKKSVGIYSENSVLGTALITNDNKIDLSGDQSIGIYTTGENNITNNGMIKIGNSLSTTNPGLGIYADHLNSNINNTSTGTINVGDNSIGIYNLNGNVINSGTITTGNEGTGIYSDGGTITLNAGSSITIGQNNAVGVYAVNQTGVVINNSSISVGDSSLGFVFSGGTTPTFTNNQSATIGNGSIFTFSDSVLTATNSGTITMTGSDNIGYFLKNGGSFVNNADIIGNTGVSNIGVYAKRAAITNNADIILGDSNLVEHTDTNGEKYKTGYSVGIYGENSNVTNNASKIIQVGKDGIGVYIAGAGNVAENYGIINGVGDNAKGIFATDNSIVRNYGTINMTGDNVMGIAGQNGAQIYNDANGVINVTGNDVTGIYLSGDNTKLINNGVINISGTGMGISYTPTVELSNINDTTGTTIGSTSKQYQLPDMPTLVNRGEININVGGNFNYDGIRVIISIDPSLNTPRTNSSSQIGFGGVIPEKVEIAPDFATGIATDRYTFENILKGATGKGEYISQSLTWDATIVGSDLIMTRKSYTDFTDGLWFEDFGKSLNEKYAVTNGEGRKIFDKLNYITNETDFRHIMGSMAGNIYANINQRENDIARTLENSLFSLQDSTNNTKENVKMNIIGGKGKNKEETDGVVGYDYTTTGVVALREVERTYKNTFGYSLGYLHTGFEFKDGNDSEEWVDTIQLGLHNKYKSNGWQLRNDLMGRVSLHNIDRNIDWESPLKRSELNGTYETYSITSENVLGKEIELGKRASIMPYGGFRAMYITRPSFQEDGLERLEVEGNDAWSVKPRLGIELKGALPLGRNSAWQLKGTLDFAYEYELSDLNEREKAKLIAVEDGYHKLSKPEDEKGTFRTKTSLGIEIEDRYGIFLTGEYGIGNSDQDDYRAGISLKAIF